MTDTTAVPGPKHFDSGVTWDGDEFHAECSCGWTSEGHLTGRAAEAAITAHRDDAAGPPDGTDLAITDLLDLGDDLADTVIWLAEHWSADLPAPFPVGTCHGTGADTKAGVRLLVYCDRAEVFTRAARVLGAPVTIDAAPDRFGGHYRRAVRCIGRVRIDAFAAAGETPR